MGANTYGRTSLHICSSGASALKEEQIQLRRRGKEFSIFVKSERFRFERVLLSYEPKRD